MNICVMVFCVWVLIENCLVFPVAAIDRYPWLKALDPAQAIVKRIAVPPGYARTPAAPDSFQDWLRQLPLKPAGAAVHLYNGDQKANQAAHFAVIDIDVGQQDLQQCADAVIRLRAEYLYAIQAYPALHFNFTNGATASFDRWRAGERPRIQGNTVKWQKSQPPDASYPNFRAYLTTVFQYAGTASLSKEVAAVPEIQAMQIGDIFIQGGFPGHAVIVVDMALHETTGQKLFLLAQSYMPAQDMHVLRNPANQALNPWYALDFGPQLVTPEWTFTREQLRRLR